MRQNKKKNNAHTRSLHIHIDICNKYATCTVHTSHRWWRDSCEYAGRKPISLYWRLSKRMHMNSYRTIGLPHLPEKKKLTIKNNTQRKTCEACRLIAITMFVVLKQWRSKKSWWNKIGNHAFRWCIPYTQKMHTSNTMDALVKWFKLH